MVNTVLERADTSTAEASKSTSERVIQNTAEKMMTYLAIKFQIKLQRFQEHYLRILHRQVTL